MQDLDRKNAEVAKKAELEKIRRDYQQDVRSRLLV